mmetsp:Transcript_19846/g.21583  ORF Transcript_19846/g.21583 Transcript_19846/m.21583 type:complete len:86 (-) Transcript_19846:174-431(-)
MSEISFRIPATFHEYTPERQTQLIQQEIKTNFVAIHDSDYHDAMGKELKKRIEEAFKLRKHITSGYEVKAKAPGADDGEWKINFY